MDGSHSKSDRLGDSQAHGPDVTRKEFCEKHMVDRGHSESCSHQDGDDDDQRNPTKVVE